MLWILETNVNTPGYTRQRPVFSTLGQSVEIAEIKRIYDRFLGAQINEQMHNLGFNEAKKNELDRVETIFNEAGGGGINELLSKFWSAWEDLSANPSAYPRYSRSPTFLILQSGQVMLAPPRR